MKPFKHVLCLDDFEPLAKALLPRPIFGYVAGAAETNQSWQRNRSVFEAYEFKPRVLVDVSARSSAVELFGHTYASPIGIAPMGLAALYAYRGDLALAAAAAAANVPMILSGTGLIKLEDVIQANPLAWFQAYLPGDDTGIEALVARAASAGYQTLVLTVDTCVPGNRENNVKAGFSTPLRPSLGLLWQGMTHPRWTLGTFLRTLALHGMPHFENSYAQRGAPIVSRHVERDFTRREHLNWAHVARIRQQWRGNFVLKGITHPEDARRAVELGVDGLIVSNHGGRQLDGTVPPLAALPGVVAACQNAAKAGSPPIPVMMDSGVRRGSDVLKAVGLGARMVFVGRPFAYAAAVGQQAGVAHGLQLLQSEVLRNMALLGVNRLDEIRLDDQLVRVA